MLTAATEPPVEIAIRLPRAAVEAAVLGNRLRRTGRLDLAALTALLLLRAAWCHSLNTAPDPSPVRPEMAAAGIRMIAGCAQTLLDQAEHLATDPRAMLAAVSPCAFAHASYPVA
jgi:hypothetical protein